MRPEIQFQNDRYQEKIEQFGLVRLYSLEVMTMHIANVPEAKAQLSALIERALAGEEVSLVKPANRLQKW